MSPIFFREIRISVILFCTNLHSRGALGAHFAIRISGGANSDLLQIIPIFSRLFQIIPIYSCLSKERKVQVRKRESNSLIVAPARQGGSVTSDSALKGRSLGPSPSTPRDQCNPRLRIQRELAAISDWRPRPLDAFREKP